MGAGDLGEPGLQGGDNFGRIVHRQGGLCNKSEVFRIFRYEAFHICNGLDQRDSTAGKLALRADHFRMARMADEDDLAALGMMAFGLDMDLGDERAGGIDIDHLAGSGFCGHRFRHAMGGKDDRPVGRTFVQFFNEYGAHGLKAADNMGIVDDFVPDIDRCAPFSEGFLDNLDRSVDPGAETAGRRKANGQGRPVGHLIFSCLCGVAPKRAAL